MGRSAEGVQMVEFGLPGGWLTMNRRPHWSTRWRLTRAWRTAACASACQQLGRTPAARRRGRTIVKVSFPTTQPNTRRDPHNWSPTVKAIVDGFVDAGVWPDDTSDQVVVIDPEFHHSPAAFSATVRVWLYPVAQISEVLR